MGASYKMDLSNRIKLLAKINFLSLVLGVPAKLVYKVRPSSKKIKTKTRHLGNPTKFRSLCQELSQQPDVYAFTTKEATENAVLNYTATTVHHGLGDL